MTLRELTSGYGFKQTNKRTNEEVVERRMEDTSFAEKILRIRELEEERKKILDQDEYVT
jgi:hypothetical protein